MPAKIELPDKICKSCGKTFNRGYLKSGRPEGIEDYRVRIFCCIECSCKFRVGNNHYLFKPEGSKRSDGYVRYSNNGRREYLHRVIMEKHLGRKLLQSEDIHHINGNPSDNRIENLQLIGRSDHLKLHNKLRERDDKGRFKT